VRLLLSAASTVDGEVVDLAVDCPDDATVGDVARQLAVRFETSVPHVLRTGGRHLGVVTIEAPEEAVSSEVPDLWLGDQKLDPTEPVTASALRNGALVGVGGQLPDIFTEPQGVVELRVASGPDSGRVHRLPPGRHLLGRGQQCSVRVADPALPEVAVQCDVDLAGVVTITPTAETRGATTPAPPRRSPLTGPIMVRRPDGAVSRQRSWSFRRRPKGMADDPFLVIDPGADRPLVHLDRVALSEPTPWSPGSVLVAGDTMVELGTPTAPDASLSPNPAGATIDFNRPPRLLPPPRKTEFTLPRKPQRPDRMPLPFLVVVAPMILGGAMFLRTQQPYTLLFVAMSPLLMIANTVQGRRTQKQRYMQAVKDFEEKTRRIEQDAFDALLVERAARRSDAPSPADVLLLATGPRARLWERRRPDADWLTVRVGTADVPSDVVLQDPAREKHHGPLTWTAPDVPVAVPLHRAGVTGIAGELADAVGRWVVAQAAALHSPADLRIVVLASEADDAQWSWVRWLPHVRPEIDSGVLADVGSDRETTSRRVAELARVLEARQAASADKQGMRFDPILVVVDGARDLRLLGGMVSLLRYGPSHGLTFVCLDGDVTLLPEECRAVVACDGGVLRLDLTGEDTVDGIRPDRVSIDWCERLGRALSPVHDVSGADAAASLPTSSRLLSVIGLDPPGPERIAAEWSTRGRTTRAVVGEGLDGVFALDLRRDGPHGLVAGTTGAGKSELLQTLIASLAVSNRPDEMTFVLVDYKGGAAFKDCANLPHTVGMVTDLDAHLTARALESLGAELRRREHLLARHGAKDIDDYLAGREPDDEPMPRLLIVIDEFAALVAELPDFVTGLVDIARRGRSLGVHLILATQRPAGVVSAEIKSNTNLRIALRVTDTADSQDVIDSDLAAHISAATPGRAYARLGHSSLAPFQSARVGGRARGQDDRPTVGIRDVAWDVLGRAPLLAGSEEDDDAVSLPTDLALLVRSVADASAAIGVHAPPSPWLPPLPELVVMDTLLDTPPVVRSGQVPPLPLGLADYPAVQRQQPMTWDLTTSSHLAVAGQGRSGRSSVLRLVAAGTARLLSPRDVHLYGIDCGNGALLPLVTMPHVGAVVGRDQPDRLRRLLALLGAEVSRRQQALATQGYADIAEQRSAAGAADRLPYLLLLLDRWEGFLAAFESVDGGVLVDQMMQLLREGPAVGLRAVVTGDRSVLTARMGSLLEDRLLLRMPAPEDYGLIGMRARDVPTRIPAGRAFRSGEKPVEVQLAVLTEDIAGTAQVACLHRLAADATAREGSLPVQLRPARVDELPVVVSYDEALALAEHDPAATALLVGVGGDTLGLRTVDVQIDGQGLLVVGPPRSGRSSALLSTVEFALDRRWSVVVITPRRSPLRALEGRPNVLGVFADTAEPDQLRRALAATRGSRLLVVDDFELLGPEHALAVVVEEYLKSIRDSADALLVACGIDEVVSMYRGPTAQLRRSRTGLILSPRAAADGDVFSARLPRSIGGVTPTGRGILVRPTGWEWLQVPRPPEARP
jgi:DNA segregation ATPase FtsK/SpoIIIE, S-DNA-T family